jgi:ubiquinone/menaquinone biosynthesis C-methylase UbiE
MTSSTFVRRSTSLLLITLLIPAAAAARQAGSVATDDIFAALNIREGSTVCEMGAGDGELTLAVAKRVGSKGRVYSSELGEDRVKALRAKIGSDRSEVVVVAGDSGKTNFPDAACDALFMRNVYHHFADPPAMNAAIANALKPGARLAIVDFTPPPGSEAACPADRGKDGMHGITPATLSRELADAGFQPVSSIAGAQRWFMIVVTKPQQQ